MSTAERLLKKKYKGINIKIQSIIENTNNTTKHNNRMSTSNTHLSIITLNINGFHYPIKRHRVIEWIKKQNLPIVYKKSILASTINTSQSKRIDNSSPNHSRNQ